MIKTATTKEQAKSLAAILGIESADMFYPPLNETYAYIKAGHVLNENKDTPAWSLSALLDVIPDTIIADGRAVSFKVELGYTTDADKETKVFIMGYKDKDGYLVVSDSEDPIDALCGVIHGIKEKNLI